MTPAEYLWTWAVTTVFLVGAVTCCAGMIWIAFLCWRGFWREDAADMKAAAERAATQQDEKVTRMVR
jgi:hypothetical protein